MNKNCTRIQQNNETQKCLKENKKNFVKDFILFRTKGWKKERVFIFSSFNKEGVDGSFTYDVDCNGEAMWRSSDKPGKEKCDNL